jgi:hypothetical protein
VKRPAFALLVVAAALLAGGATGIVQDQCGPFTDVTPGFCPYVLELYYLGITAGTSATTFSPDDPLTRGQGAVFIAKGLNQSLARSSRRAALGQWGTTTPHYDLNLGTVAVGTHPIGIASDGADLWVANQADSTVSRVRASDGKLLETWPDMNNATCLLVAMGRVFVTSGVGPLMMIDPSQPPALTPTTVANLGISAGLAFDGSRIWVANNDGSVSIVTPGSSLPWAATNVTTGFLTPEGVLFDGSNVWVTDYQAGTLLRLDGNGAILQTVTTGFGASFPAYDGRRRDDALGSAGQPRVRRVRRRARAGRELQRQRRVPLRGRGLRPARQLLDGRRFASLYRMQRWKRILALPVECRPDRAVLR